MSARFTIYVRTTGERRAYPIGRCGARATRRVHALRFTREDSEKTLNELRVRYPEDSFSLRTLDGRPIAAEKSGAA